MYGSLIALKLKQHLQGFWMAVFGMFLFSTMGWLIINSFEYVLERMAPYHWYFEVSEIKPVEETFVVGYYPQFRTFIKYTSDTPIEWHDTLYCKTRRGGIIKYPTQVTYGYGLENVNDYNKIWVYWKHKLSQEDRKCKLQTLIVAKTRFGFDKKYVYETNWIRVKAK